MEPPMIGPLLEQLAHAMPDRSLDRLEADIWSGIAARERARRITRIVLASQGVVLAVALLGSLVAGQRWAAASALQADNPFSPQWTLAASTRLLGTPK